MLRTHIMPAMQCKNVKSALEGIYFSIAIITNIENWKMIDINCWENLIKLISSKFFFDLIMYYIHMFHVLLCSNL